MNEILKFDNRKITIKTKGVSIPAKIRHFNLHLERPLT